MKKKYFNLIIYIFGFIILLYTLKVVLGKVEEAIIKGENVLTVSMLLNPLDVIILSSLSIVFLYLIFADDKKQFFAYIKKFLSWAVYTSISAILIYFLILIPHFRESFTFIIIAVLFSLFILYERLKK